MKFKKLLQCGYKYIFNSDYRFKINAAYGRYNAMPDEKYLKKLFRISMGKELNLEHPVTFNEKLQWLKLYDRQPEYTKLVDKYEVKKIVAGLIGEEYVIPTYGVWERFDDIDFDRLPEQFVLKCTHDSGGLYICKSKKQFDKTAAKKKIETALKRNYFWTGREWPYKNVKPRIIAEQYMEDSKYHELRDYKFFCFNGTVKALFIASDRQTPGKETKFDFFDEQFNSLPFKQGHPNSAILPEKPVNFDKMKRIAEKLSTNIPHVRIDLYEVNDQILFGEMTFSHYSGFVRFEPEEWDEIFGSWIDLPND